MIAPPLFLSIDMYGTDCISWIQLDCSVGLFLFVGSEHELCLDKDKRVRFILILSDMTTMCERVGRHAYSLMFPNELKVQLRMKI